MARGPGLRTFIVELNVTATTRVLMKNNFLLKFTPQKCVWYAQMYLSTVQLLLVLIVSVWVMFASVCLILPAARCKDGAVFVHAVMMCASVENVLRIVWLNVQVVAICHN